MHPRKAGMKHHLRLHCQDLEYNLLVRTSAADQIKNICMLDYSRCDQLARYSWPRHRARRALQGKACHCDPAVCRARRGIVANRVRRGAQAAAVQSMPVQLGARRAINTPAQGVPPPQGDLRRRRHHCRSVPPLAHSLSSHFHAAGRPTSPSVAASMKHHLRLYCQHFP